MPVSVELFVSPYCQCGKSTRRLLRERVERLAPGARWREINVLDELDRAAALGVRVTPSVVVNERVITSGRLDLDALDTALEANHVNRHRKSRRETR